MRIEDLAKVFVGDALVEAVVQGDGIKDAVLERAKEVKKAFVAPPSWLECDAAGECNWNIWLSIRWTLIVFDLLLVY